ncbi:MAG: IPT/TIG domain-containing protein, partial [Phycisphaerae bacterium]
MLTTDYLSPSTRARTRLHWLIGRRVARFGSLLVCLAGVGLISGCGPVLDEFFGSAQEPPPAPASLQISPARGPVLGGTRVSITGANTAVFGPGTDVLFGAFLATETEIVNEKTIRATAPAQAAGRVDVVVRVASGSTVTYPAGFEYVAIKDADAEIVAQIEAMFPGPPRLVSAVSTGNLSARVTFSEPVRDGATDTSNYFIVIPDGGHLLLDQTAAPVLSEDHTVVDLTTLSQADALYRLTVTGIKDLAGNPIAPPDMLVNPAETTFTGIAPANLDEHIDSDGDGFADWFEMLGWEMTIELANGQVTQGYVTSDPFNPDTDGDGLTDGEENARSMDPRTDDTDADLVLDWDEVFDWRSNPCDQDSDDDGFADQTELHFGTSLILADTDGDQLDDRDELLNRNRNPRIADLPIPVVTVGEMNLELDERYTYTDQFGETHQVQESYSSTLQRDTSS